MSPTIRNDPARPSGGHALLEAPGLAGVTAVTVENVASGLFLSAGGRWAKLPHPFPVELQGDALRLGPAVVDHVPEELLVALRSDDGRDLGRVFWQGIMPSRSRTVVAPPPPPASPVSSPATPTVLPPELPPSPPPPPDAFPEIDPRPASVTVAPLAADRPVRRWAAGGAVLVAILAAGGAWALLRGPAPTPTPPPPAAAQDQAARCVRDFGARATAARAGSDDDRVKAAEAALAGGCGAQAFAALDGADWEMSEAAAWHLARFYDPNETDAAVRAAAAPHPDWAAAYYARWAPRVSREAAALKQLCTTDAAALDANAQAKRACGR